MPRKPASNALSHAQKSRKYASTAWSPPRDYVSRRARDVHLLRIGTRAPRDLDENEKKQKLHASMALWVERARLGEKRAALRVMKHYVSSVRCGERPDPEVETYLADVFEHHLGGKDSLDSAIGLQPRRGNASLHSNVPQVVVAMCEAEKAHNPIGYIKRVADALGMNRKDVDNILTSARRSTSTT